MVPVCCSGGTLVHQWSSHTRDFQTALSRDFLGWLQQQVGTFLLSSQTPWPASQRVQNTSGRKLPREIPERRLPARLRESLRLPSVGPLRPGSSQQSPSHPVGRTDAFPRRCESKSLGKFLPLTFSSLFFPWVLSLGSRVFFRIFKVPFSS